MTTVTTPSQLKKEVESQKELLLRACLEAFKGSVPAEGEMTP